MVASQRLYGGITVASQRLYGGIMVASQRLYGGITEVLRWYHEALWWYHAPKVTIQSPSSILHQASQKPALEPALALTLAYEPSRSYGQPSMHAELFSFANESKLRGATGP